MSTMIKTAGIGAVSALALAAATSAHAIDMRAGDTEVSLYGYAQLNASYDFDERLGDATGMGFPQDFAGDADDGYFDMDATQSRFGFTTETPAAGSTLMTNIEADFRGDGDTGQPRLRHAYGSWNGILAGQTWSNFSSFVGNSPALDFNGPAGRNGTQGRNAQLRYTMGDFSIAAEELRTNILGATETKRELPDLSAKFEGGAGAINYAVGAAVQFLGTGGDESEDATRYGAFAGASFEVAPGTSINGGVNWGDGVVSPYIAGNFDNPNAYVDADGDLETIETMGAQIGLSQDMGMGTFGIGYSWSEIDYDGVAAFDGLIETNQDVFANYTWSPVNNVTYGAELAWRDVETPGGDDADGMRLKMIASYAF